MGRKKKIITDLKDALMMFDLSEFMAWSKKHNNSLWHQLEGMPEVVQMATMCKVICNRTDMLNTGAHKKAVRWLKEHDMKGRLF